MPAPAPTAALTPVHVVDDDPEVLASLALLLRSHGWRVQAHSSAAALLAALDRGVEAGAVVADVRMPGIDGLGLLQLLKSRGAIPVVIVTGHADVPLAVRAMREGAADFIEKPYEGERMIAAVTEALATGARERAKSRIGAEAAARLAQLSARECQVLDLLLGGNSNKLVAARLGISVRTAEVHRANLMEKLKVRDLPALVRLAMDAGRPPWTG